MMEIYAMGSILLGLAVVAFSQQEIQKLKQHKNNNLKEEIERHQLQMKLLKMQKEKAILEGKNKCWNVSKKNLL